MSAIDFGSAFRPAPIPQPPAGPTEAEMVLARLEILLRDFAAILARAPEPNVQLAAPDLTEMVNAVVGIKGPATAEEIAEAIARRLRFPEPVAPTDLSVLVGLREALETLDFRLKGQAFGSTVAAPPDTAKEATLQQLRDRADYPLPTAQVADLKTVTVTNPTANPETGLAKDATLTGVRDRLPAALNPDGGINVHLVNVPPEFEEFTVLASAARTASFNTDAAANPRHKGLRLYLNITAVSGTLPTLDIRVQTREPISGTWVDMAGAAFPQATAVGTHVLVVYPGINQTTVGATVRVSNIMSRNWRLASIIGGTAPSLTFSVAGIYLP